MNLYFLDDKDKQHLVAKDITEENAWEYAEADLAKRRPDFKVHYTRQWWDKYFRHWIDYGSHTEFYILQDANRALNVVKDVVADTQDANRALNVEDDSRDNKNKPKGPACTKDHCDI